MNKRVFHGVCAVIITILIAGCATRSISDAGPPGHAPSDNPFYLGELTEFQVLGIESKQAISDADGYPPPADVASPGTALMG